jgi:hypothetical protein
MRSILLPVHAFGIRNGNQMSWICGSCGRTIAIAEIAYRQDHRRLHWCRDCAPKERIKWSTILKCPICGAREGWYWSIPKLKTDCCGRACRKKMYRDREAQGYKRCSVCREWFRLSRSHALHCSNACRQKAYRRRGMTQDDSLRLALQRGQPPGTCADRGVRG